MCTGDDGPTSSSAAWPAPTPGTTSQPLPIDLSGVNGTFTALETAVVEAGVVEAIADGLEPGTTYQWYATVTGCNHTVTTPVTSFATAP